MKAIALALACTLALAACDNDRREPVDRNQVGGGGGGGPNEPGVQHPDEVRGN